LQSQEAPLSRADGDALPLETGGAGRTRTDGATDSAGKDPRLSLDRHRVATLEAAETPSAAATRGVAMTRGRRGLGRLTRPLINSAPVTPVERFKRTLIFGSKELENEPDYPGLADHLRC
jgi:hypothetical protein